MNLRKWVAAAVLAASIFCLTACGEDAAVIPPEETITVRVLSAIRISYSNGDPWISQQCSYNDNGNLIKVAFLNMDQEETGKITITYDSATDQMLYKRFQGDTQSLSFLYDANNNQIALIYPYASGEERYRMVYSYDDKGSPLQCHIVKPGEPTELYEDHKYDANGNLIEYLSYFTGGKQNDRIVYSYNSDNKLVSETHYSRSNNITSQRISTYDSTGNLISRVTYYNDIEEARTDYYYDANNRLVEEKDYKYGISSGSRSYLYDANNNPIQRVSVTDAYSTETTTLTYDELGVVSRSLTRFSQTQVCEYIELTVPQSRVNLILRQQKILEEQLLSGYTIFE